jgi:hypothetical protein
VKRVGRPPEPEQFGVDPRTTGHRVIHGLEDQYGSAFGQDEPVPVGS